METKTKQLLSDPPLPLLLKMATPNSIAFFIQSGVSMTEVWFIGQLGTTSLAAIALVFPLLMLMQTTAAGALGGAVTSVIARSLGAGSTARAERVVWHALTLAVAGTLFFLITFLAAGEFFLSFLGGSDETLQQATNYCLVLFSGGLFLWLVGVVSAIYRGMGNMHFPASMMIVSALIQIPLSGVLVLGAFGVPSLGIVGAAVSAVTAGFVISCIMLIRLALGNYPVKLNFSQCQLSRKLFQDLMKVFLPASLSPLVTAITIVSLTAIVGRFGEHALAGYGIGSRIEFLMIPLVFGIGASMTSLVGMSIGAGNVARAERIGWVGGSTACLLSGAAGIVLALIPEIWIPLFSKNPDVIDSATQYIQIVGPCYAFLGLGLSLYFASQGAGRMFWPVVAILARFIIAVGGAIMLASALDFGLAGVYYATATGMVVFGCTIAGSIWLGSWRESGETGS